MMGNRSWLRNSITVATATAISISIIVEFLLLRNFCKLSLDLYFTNFKIFKYLRSSSKSSSSQSIDL